MRTTQITGAGKTGIVYNELIVLLYRNVGDNNCLKYFMAVLFYLFVLEVGCILCTCNRNRCNVRSDHLFGCQQRRAIWSKAGMAKIVGVRPSDFNTARQPAPSQSI